jgi:hypothetical protein
MFSRFAMLLLRCSEVSPGDCAQGPLDPLTAGDPHGDEGTRTPDLCLAKAPLSQLSYVPALWV